MKEYTARNIKETNAIARKVVSDALSAKKKKTHATILALYGNLGSGKTRFAQAVAKILGIQETVPSPTFILERVYPIKKFSYTKFIHIDAYRLENAKDLKQIGWDEIKKDPKNIILIEWADKAEKALPKDALRIHFEHAGEKERKIRIN